MQRPSSKLPRSHMFPFFFNAKTPSLDHSHALAHSLAVARVTPVYPPPPLCSIACPLHRAWLWFYSVKSSFPNSQRRLTVGATPCSLGHGPIHIAVAAPTTIAITMPLPSLPQLLASRHHPATYPAHAATTMCHQRFQGRRNTLRCHAEGFRWCLALWQGAERVCSPLLGSKAPSVKTHYFMVSSGQRLDV